MDRDLYYLVKFLPAYNLPRGMPSMTDLSSIDHPPSPLSPSSIEIEVKDSEDVEGGGGVGSSLDIHPVQSKTSVTSGGIIQRLNSQTGQTSGHIKLPPVETTTSPTRSVFGGLRERRGSVGMTSMRSGVNFLMEKRTRQVIPAQEEAFLFPASMPPKYTIFDLFPFSLFIKMFEKRGHEVKGKKAQRIRAKMLQKTISHNLPLELSLYLVSQVIPAIDGIVYT